MRNWYPKLLCLGLLVVTQAHAQDGFFSKLALNAGLSGGQLSLDKDSFVSPTTTVRGFSANATAWVPSVGIELNRYISAELGYFNGGSPSQEVLVSSPAPASLPAGTYVTETDTVQNHAWLGSAVAGLALNENVVVFARGGILSWKTKTNVYRLDETYDATDTLVASSQQFFTAKKSGTDPFYGVGVALNVDNGTLRLEYDLSTINDADARYISLGIVWKFSPWR